MKYAFKGIDERELTIEITDGEDHVRILAERDWTSSGFPRRTDSLGVQLVYVSGTAGRHHRGNAESGTRFDYI